MVLPAQNAVSCSRTQKGPWRSKSDPLFRNQVFDRGAEKMHTEEDLGRYVRGMSRNFGISPIQSYRPGVLGCFDHQSYELLGGGLDSRRAWKGQFISFLDVPET